MNGNNRLKFFKLFVVAMSVTLIAGCVARPGNTGTHEEKPVNADQKNVPPKQFTAKSVFVRLSSITTGFNPHLMANQSTSGLAIASLILPSPFVPEVNVPKPTIINTKEAGDLLNNSNGLVPIDSAEYQPNWVQRKDLVTQVTYTPGPVTTIVYKINPDAQWSDGVPINANDFIYLWQQMIKNQQVVGKAGYELIKDITSADSGKTVTVKLSHPYAAWKSLFMYLLPSHALIDKPDGFINGLEVSPVISGSYFMINYFDPYLQQVVLVRNERYWGTPTPLDSIILRKSANTSDTINFLRTNDDQVDVVEANPTVQQLLSTIQGVTSFQQPTSQSLSIRLNPYRFNKTVRDALVSYINPQFLYSAATEGNIAEPVYNQIPYLSNLDPDAANLIPAKITKTELQDIFKRLGFYKQNNSAKANPPPTSSQNKLETSPTPTTQRKPQDNVAPSPENVLVNQNNPLKMSIGVSVNDATALSVARTLSDQLTEAGITVTIKQLNTEEFTQGFSPKSADFLIGNDMFGTDEASDAVSLLNCGIKIEPSKNDPVKIDPTKQTCPDSIKLASARLLTDDTNDSQFIPDLTQIESYLWDDGLRIPILQQVSLVSYNSRILLGLTLNPLPAGIFTSARNWQRK